DAPAAVPQVRVASTRAALAPAAANLFGHPSRSLRVAGVTGTNGKTTTTFLLQAVFEAHGWSTEVIGTLGGARTAGPARRGPGPVQAGRGHGGVEPRPGAAPGRRRALPGGRLHQPVPGP